ncbi:MAG: c-type cytochrome biogenesis protein CcsB [Desulfuromonas sp.]|mgnify:FL=1|nr:MAG: c-type cytochrome biogenesis protein CcsB [Desulfuromonas sp.]
MTSSSLFNIVTFGYFVAMILFLVFLATRSRQIALIANVVSWVGLALHTAAFGYRWVESYQMGYGRIPLTNLYESAVFFAWSVVLFYVLLDLKYKQPAIGAFVIPFAFLTMNWAQLGYLPQGIRSSLETMARGMGDSWYTGFARTMLLGPGDTIEPLVPALQSNWLTYHVITCFIGYGAFAVACGVSVMYLIKARQEERAEEGAVGGLLGLFPSIKVLDDINYKAILVGFPLLTLGIITGAAWANYAWGTYWSWDPKETWSLIVWFIYAAFLHARFTRGWVGKRAAWLSIFGFAATLFCYLGVNLLLSGLHSYGGG